MQEVPPEAMYKQVRSELAELGASAVLQTLRNYTALCQAAKSQPAEGQLSLCRLS